MKFKFSSVLGVFALVVGLVATVSLAVNGGRLSSKAAEEAVPSDVRITNLADNSITVSFVTQKASGGSVMYGTKPDGLTPGGYDDQKGETHWFQLKNLKPATMYYFKVGADTKFYGRVGVSSEPYAVVTAPVAAVPPVPDETYGKIVTKEGNPAVGAIVYIRIGESTLLSAMTDNNGRFALDLGNARAQNLKSYFLFSRKTAEINVEAIGSFLDKAQVKILSAQTQPMPTITLGVTQDLTKEPLTVQQTESQKTVSQVPETKTDTGLVGRLQDFFTKLTGK